MMDFITSLGSWNWFILGFVLLAVEVMVPGYFFLWIGVSALIVGFSTLLITWPWQIQLLGFAVLSVASAYFGKRMLGYADDEASEDPHLNKRGSRLEGRTFKLEEAIEHGTGRIRVDDSIWRVSGPDTPAGATVRVTGVDGATLTVEPA